MADFKIERIRFRWKNIWTGSTAYIKDDIVIYQGKAFVCLIGHTSNANFYIDLEAASPKWGLMLDGYEWRADWAPSTYYSKGDIAKFKANILRCITPHTSAATTTLGLPADSSKWEYVTQVVNWLNEWTISTSYDLRDVIRYNGYVYSCNTKHVSAATTVLGLEAHQAYWTIVTVSDHWSGDWTINTRYRYSDVMRYNGILYRCIIGHTSGTITFDEDSTSSEWEIVTSGVEYRSEFTDSTRYRINDVVKYGGSLWRCLIEYVSTSLFREDENPHWELYLPGLEFERIWDEQKEYSQGDIVLYGGYVYAALQNNSNSVPSVNGKVQDTGSWELLKEGYTHKGEFGEDSSDQEYKTGDVVRHTGYLYICLTDSEGEVPDTSNKWQILVSGSNHRAEWDMSATYNLKDIVLYSSSAYIAIQRHISSSSTRPDIDTTNWTLLVQGTASNVLTQRGDLRTHFSEADSTLADERLPIGLSGEVLKTLTDSNWQVPRPTWSNVGAIDKVYFVGNHGQDISSAGSTEQNPFKTIKFACDYIQGDLATRAPATVFVKSGTYEEILPISIPATVGLVGDELRSVKVKPAPGYEQSDMFYVRNACGIRNMHLQGLKGNWYRASVKTDGVHGNSDGDLVEIRNIEVACVLGSKTYPLVSTTTAFTVLASFLTGNVFQVDLGTSAINHTYVSGGTVVKGDGTRLAITDFNFNTGSGIATITTATHGLSASDTVNLFGIVTSCAYGTKVYPQMPHAGIYPVSVVGTTNLNFFLPPSNLAHTHTSGGTVQNVSILNVGSATNITAFNYANESGYTTVTSTNHGLSVGDYVKLQNIKVSCSQGEKIYPDSKTSSGIFYVYEVIDANTFAFGMDTSTFTHNYTSGGTVQKVTWTTSNAKPVLNFTYTSDGIINEHGTKRPTAGAFVSLDPGTGPDDDSVWVTTKSTYVQNVTTFGTKCVGMKIDGSIHNGGLRSIVANDFTQIIVDGIGYWALYNGLSELVSVFTYYSHIGYLSEFGGRLRATNGNNSYGDFGSVSEGVNPTETAIIGKVDNKSKDAQISVVETDGVRLLAFGYSNAGQEYTTATPTISGSGYGSNVTYEEFRKDAISEVRITDPGDSSTSGGLGYTYKLNTGQGGDSTTITLSAADTEGTAVLYRNQRIVIVGGKGAGQYGTITDFDPITKICQVSRESDMGAGWEHLYSGYQIETTLDTSSRYSIEPRVDIEWPTWTKTSQTCSVDVLYLTTSGTGASNNFIAANKSGANPGAIVYSEDHGANWTNSTLTGSTLNLGLFNNIIGNKKNNNVLALIEGHTVYAGRSTDKGVNFTEVTLPNGANWIDAAFGDNEILVISSGSATEIAKSSNGGDTWTAGTTISGEHFNIVYGNGKYIVTTYGNTFSTSPDGDTWSTVNVPISSDWRDIAYGNGTFVAVGRNDSAVIYSSDGVTWYTAYVDIEDMHDSTAINWAKVEYNAGVWMITNETNDTVITSQSASSWYSYLDDSARKSLGYTSGALAVTSGENNLSKPIWMFAPGLDDSTSSNLQIVQFGAKPLIRSVIAGSRISGFTIYDPGSGYAGTPTVTVTDNTKTDDVTFTVRMGSSGVLTQPVFTNRGADFNIASATVIGDGYGDIYQLGGSLVLKNVTKEPGPGDNLIISGINDIIYKVVSIDKSTGSEPTLAIELTISPRLGLAESPDHDTDIEIRQNYSQVRLTGHDFLDVGTGDFSETDYPRLYTEGFNFVEGFEPKQQNEVVEKGGGRVFYTSTDQDGNFRVGELFLVEQSTGVITLNADLFNFTGLEDISIGGFQVGGTVVVINEFSKEPTFFQNSDTIVPTQKATASYITSRVSGGGANAATNQLNVGQIRISDDTISAIVDTIVVPGLVNITGGINGSLLANMYYIGMSDQGHVAHGEATVIGEVSDTGH